MVQGTTMFKVPPLSPTQPYTELSIMNVHPEVTNESHTVCQNLTCEIFVMLSITDVNLTIVEKRRIRMLPSNTSIVTILTNTFFPLGKMIGTVRSPTSFIL